MKAALLFLALATSALGVDHARFLEAIATREASTTPGPAGETGRWQMMPATRRDAGGDDRAAAFRHVRRIEREFEQARIDCNVFNLALAWNAGVERVRAARCEVRHYRYALEVERIYRARDETARPSPR